MDTLTSRAVKLNPKDFCVFIDNESTMRREAVSIYTGAVNYFVSASALVQTDRRRRLELLGDIGDAPWGAFIGREAPQPKGE